MNWTWEEVTHCESNVAQEQVSEGAVESPGPDSVQI